MAVAEALAGRSVTFRTGVGEVRVQGRLVTMAGETVQLSERERAVLAALARRPGVVVSKAELLHAAWPGGEADEHAVEVAWAASAAAWARGAVRWRRCSAGATGSPSELTVAPPGGEEHHLPAGAGCGDRVARSPPRTRGATPGPQSRGHDRAREQLAEDLVVS